MLKYGPSTPTQSAMSDPMSAVHKPLPAKLMPYTLRPMTPQDLAQAAEIERDAFPTLFPPTSFRRELKNRMARYIVAVRRDDLCQPAATPSDAAPKPAPTPHAARLDRIINGARNLWQRRPGAWQPGQQYIAGFLGAWHMHDEAHIIAVGVRSPHRSQGIGELLLIGAIEQAIARGMQSVTLEVRVSNYIAQNLYKKYGFKRQGVRKAYYVDNHEDALIMTAADICEPLFSQDLRLLIRAHRQRWGASDRTLA